MSISEITLTDKRGGCPCTVSNGAEHRLEAYATLGRRLGKRRRRIGVWGNKATFRHGHNDQEVSTELMALGKRRHADTPIRFPY